MVTVLVRLPELRRQVPVVYFGLERLPEQVGPVFVLVVEEID